MQVLWYNIQCLWIYLFGRKANSMTRSEKIINQVVLQPNQAILLSKPSNIFYASGYTGEGYALIAHNLNAIVTDFRYTEQAQKQAPAFTPYEVKTGLSHNQLSFQVLKDHGVDTVLFEADEVTVSAFDKLKSDMPNMVFVPLNGAVEKVREIKDESEIQAIQRACNITDQAFSYILTEIKEGMSEMDIRVALEFKMLSLGASSLAFDTIVASGENGSLCHAIPSTRKIQKGDMITMDFGAKKDGYCSDMTRTVSLGQPNDEMRTIYNTVLHAQKASQDALKAGVTGAEIDSIARQIIDDAGYKGMFGHGLGHSVGIDIHENPRLSQTCHDVMKENIIMTVEPGIYKPNLGGVRIENTVLITNEGALPLTQSNKELIIL